MTIRKIFCGCKAGTCVLGSFWVVSVLRGNSQDSSCFGKLCCHFHFAPPCCSQWEGNFTLSASSLQRVLQTLFHHFIPCVILVSPERRFITNSICSENCFPFKQPKPVGWETTSKRSGISAGSGNSVLAGCLAGQQAYFFICLIEGFDHGDKQLKNACKESYLLEEGQWLHTSRALFTLFGCFWGIKELKNLLVLIKEIVISVI